MTVRFSGLELTDHFFTVPLDYAKPAGETIEIFGREVCAVGTSQKDLPWLVFFQGGPGHGSPRPVENGGWLEAATERFRVFLLDQRGTARSTPVLAQTLTGRSDAEVAEYLRHFRADSIVRDAEIIRKKLTRGRPWTGLGQSYGGFCLLQYLSQSPDGLSAVLITGGIPPIFQNAEQVYRATYDRVEDRNRRYFERYPKDADLLMRIAERLRRDDVRLPSGGPFSVNRLLEVGHAFGMSNGFEAVHYLLEDAFVQVQKREELSYRFLRNMDNQSSFEIAPIYAILHESIYAQSESTRWAAERVRKERPQFDSSRTDKLLFTGEMVYPWMFEEYPHLRPLAGAAELLANYEDWAPLYDLDQLSRNQVPVAAIVYDDDMYVERRFCDEVARHVPKLQTWITNEYDHNGLRADGKRIFRKLLSMTEQDEKLP